MSSLKTTHQKPQFLGKLSWSNLRRVMFGSFAKKHSYDELKDVSTAKDMMQKHKINCLPVIRNKELLGIITSSDF